MSPFFRLTFLSVVIFALAIPSAHARQPSGPPDPSLYRDTTQYPPFKLTWTQNPDMKQVHGVFPSPIKSQQAALATESGLYLSTDAGHTWNALPEATAAKVGIINDVAFHPLSPDVFYIASQTSGVWATNDQGKTFVRAGSKDKGLASDTVASLIFYTGDPTHQTLLAAHGDTAPGISRSRDNGTTWDVVNTDYKFRRLLGGEGEMNEFFLFGSSLKDGDVQSIYSCNTLGEFLIELVHDVVPTDMAYAPGVPIPYGKTGTLYATTSDSGAYHIDDNASGDMHNAVKLPFKSVDGWASTGATWGPSADVINLFLYDPTKTGFVISSDDLATLRTASDGLLLSPLVKDGAVIRPNTNGTVFYNVVNGTLAVGRMPDDVPVVEVNPPAVELGTKDQKSWRKLALALQKFNRDTGNPATAAKALVQDNGNLKSIYHDHAVTVTAQLPTKPAPTSVTVDMSRFGGTPAMPLYDDGKHDDGAAGDGLYCGTFAFLPESHRTTKQEKDWRSSWPGRVALGVTATYADGHHTGAVAVETIYTQINDITPWRDNWNKFTTSVEGDVTAEMQENPREVHSGAHSITIKANKGHWAVHMNIPDSYRDITSHEAVAFWLKAMDGTPPKEFNLQLKDHPEFSDATTTDSAPVLNGLVPNATEQRVIVPISQLVAGAPKFQSDHLGEIILSGDADAPLTLVISDLQILVQNDQAAAPTAK